MRTATLGVARLVVAWALACAAACSDNEPYRLRLHVADATACASHERALVRAIEFWSEHGVNAFEYFDCFEDDFDARPVVRFVQAPPDARAYTTDLTTFSDHVAVYVVETITLDGGKYDVAMPQGAGLPSHVTPCPGLVASTRPSSILYAHELGHLVWMQHDDDPRNLMYGGGHDQDLEMLELTSEQIDFANEAFADCWKQR
jgi:hypothetical protein